MLQSWAQEIGTKMKLRLALLLALVGACFAPTRQAAPCVSDENCNLSAGGQCLPSPLGVDQCAYPDPACPSGLSWGELSPSLHGQCTSDVDAGVDATDAMDAPDAPIDAGPSGPIVENNQPADLVIGQVSFTTLADRGYAANSLQAGSIAATPEGLWVADEARARVLYFSPLPSIGDPSAALAVGRPSLTDSSAVTAPSASNLGTVLSVGAGGGRLLIADKMRNRVLIWNSIPATSGVPADVVLGQPDMTSTAPGNGASQLAGPGCVWTDGTRVVVCDVSNHRLLLWNSFPSSNGAAADVVLGQPSFGLSGAPSTPSASNMSWPYHVTFDGARLYLAELDYNRTLVWEGFPTANGAAAAIVLGQASFTESRSVAASAIYTGDVAAVARFRDAVLVADSSHDRVVVWQPVPSASGSGAALVLGQPDLNTHNTSTVPAQNSFRRPGGLAVVGDKLFVADFYNRRVLRFSLQ